jgi:hypothetical protein
MSKDLTQAFAKVARGILQKCPNIFINEDNQPELCYCPTCAKVREIAEWEWRSTDDKTWRYDKPFTVQIIRATLETLGLWERFKTFNSNQGYYAIKDKRGFLLELERVDADILTTDNLMAEATLEFLEGLCEKK